MLFDDKKKLIFSAALLILVAYQDIVKACSSCDNPDKATTKAPTDLDGMYIYRKSSSFNNSM